MDDLFDKLLNALIELIESGEEIPDEVFQEVTALLMQKIQSLGKAKLPTQAQVPQVPSAPYPSSNVFGFNYNPQDGKLLIKYMGKDTAESGPTYQYSGIPPYIFEVLKRGAVAPRTSGKNKYHAWFKGKTPSHGASVYALIKEAGFPYKKVA